ncbi:biosynthetic-type acetolactate synthase large subunit [Holophaga foetida]|uniref:biosynthetic-type acetolactate synthase large subunit n=1 Tax=Holophaga foetida TaxID=35839 RepID=UPI0002472AE8|nr:biosynthetic-type acetolactate synthase large subunit [Holophaga foetida]
MELSGAQIIWESLIREGVDTVFGYPGGTVINLYDALLDYPAIHHVLARHEQGACHMADGYSRASGRTGVVIATSGPGAMNLVTGLANAMLDSIPMVAITGQVRSNLLGSDAFQEIDVTGVTLPITKHNYLVQRPEDIAPAIREAFAVARTGRPGPVLVDITTDAQKLKGNFDWDAAAPKRHLRHIPRQPSEEALEQACRLIRHAKRPVILAGNGIRLSSAEAELCTLAEKLNVPVITTLMGINALPASHPLNMGMLGMHGESWTNKAVQGADLLIALGMRFSDRVTGDLKTFAPHAKKIHVDVDSSEIDKNVKVDVPVVADLRAALTAMLPRLEAMEHDEWLGHIRSTKGEAQAEAILGHEGLIQAPQVIHEIWKATEGKALMVSDVGQNQMWEAQYYKHEHGLITSGGLGTMGFGLPAAIGAKMGRPDREVWIVAGDGGFQMNIQELMTIIQEGLKVNIAVVNNGYLGMVRQWQELFYERRYASTPILSPDFVKVAAAYGIAGESVSSFDDVAPAIQRARAESGSYLIEFRVEPELSVFPMVPAGASLHDMLRRPEHAKATAKKKAGKR